MNEYYGNCVIDFNGAAFTGTAFYQPENADDEISAMIILKINILDAFKELAAAKLNCDVDDLEIDCEMDDDAAVIYLVDSTGGDIG